MSDGGDGDGILRLNSFGVAGCVVVEAGDLMAETTSTEGTTDQNRSISVSGALTFLREDFRLTSSGRGVLRGRILFPL